MMDFFKTLKEILKEPLTLGIVATLLAIASVGIKFVSKFFDNFVDSLTEIQKIWVLVFILFALFIVSIIVIAFFIHSKANK